jgi:hypothetical protein
MAATADCCQPPQQVIAEMRRSRNPGILPGSCLAKSSPQPDEVHRERLAADDSVGTARRRRPGTSQRDVPTREFIDCHEGAPKLGTFAQLLTRTKRFSVAHCQSH